VAMGEKLKLSTRELEGEIQIFSLICRRLLAEWRYIYKAWLREIKKPFTHIHAGAERLKGTTIKIPLPSKVIPLSSRDNWSVIPLNFIYYQGDL